MCYVPGVRFSECTNSQFEKTKCFSGRNSLGIEREDTEKKKGMDAECIRAEIRWLEETKVNDYESYKEGKNRFYTPLVAEKEYLAVENKAFLEKVNNHSVTKLVASLYDSHSITEEDLDELAAFIRSKTGGA